MDITRVADRPPEAAATERLRIEIRGAVQGVGFRPFVYRLATELGLRGWVVNDARGVAAEVEGPRPVLDEFLARLEGERPPHARIHRLESRRLHLAGFSSFEIRRSDTSGDRTAVPLPDLATCPECLAEVLDPRDRRHHYPFANCTRCGPRFTIVRALPYDRPNTTMSEFALCERCRAEYEDPADRRFHAQPIACPRCGPALALWGPTGAVTARGDDALIAAARALEQGRVVAVKGLGGFHLMCDAADARAIARLRDRKPRLEKPLALMVRDLDQARALCQVSEAAAEALSSPAAPILLLPRRDGAPVAANVAPGYPTLGLMVPATPLHHLLLRAVGRPLVATSGNAADEPIATDERDALRRLAGIAELWLVHDRPIERHMDDSVGWMVEGGFAPLRRGRGLAPLAIPFAPAAPPILAVGAQLKSTIAFGVRGQAFLSQHVGDLETPEAIRAFERVIADFQRLYDARPAAIAHDLHPDYVSTQWALRSAAGGPGPRPRLVAVQHHHAHLASCLAEHGIEGPALGVTWDGTGDGGDGTVWGGEFLLGGLAEFRRVAHLWPFRLPGGEAAVREPRRVALALLWELIGEAALDRDDLAAVRSFSAAERRLLGRMLAGGVSAPLTTSAGRLFDGVSALLGLSLKTSFEGQAAAALEFAADPAESAAYRFEIQPAAAVPWVVDWRPALRDLLADLAGGTSPGRVAARFHNLLVEAIAAVAGAVGEPRVALTGGCFQNRMLLERAARRLRDAGHQVLLHRSVPPGDGGISLGQLAVAAARLRDPAPPR